MISRSLKQWLTRRPGATRATFAVLRRRGQVLRIGKSTIALGHSAVIEILANSADFTIGEANRDGFATGPVLLYTDEGEAYYNDRSALDNAFCPELKEIIERDTEDLITRHLARPSEQLDVVADFAEPIIATIIARHFFGFNPTDEQLPDFRKNLRILGTGLIDGEVSPQARQSAEDIVKLANNRRSQPTELDLAARLHASTNPPVTCPAGSVAGLSLAATATVARGLGQVVDCLIKRIHLLEKIEQAIESSSCNTSELIDQLIRESLRFTPVLVFIRRYTIRDTQLSAASGGAVIPRGSRVLVGLSSAMFDASAFPNPEDFRLDRPAESYLHFGYGLHRCYGSMLAEMFLQKMVSALIQHRVLVGAKNESAKFESWALTSYRISLANRS